MSSKKILPVPERNHFYCQQDQQLNGFTISDSQKNILYEAIGKAVVTRSHYRIRRKSDAVAIASVDQEQIETKYTISGTHDQELAKVEFTKDQVILIINDIKFLASSGSRGKRFEFYKGDEIVLTLDKKILSLQDSYHVMFIADFPSLIAAVLPIAIDDFFHYGTSR